jgi:periplasmic protein CpxP/Spy
MSSTRNRNLLIIITVLLLTNIAVLVYFLSPKKKGSDAAQRNEKYGVAEMLQKEVGFDDDQTAKYKEMKEKQRERIRPMYDDMRKAKDSLFRLLSFPETNDSVLTKMADAIAQKQKAIDLETFNHFKRVRVLCKADQLTKFDSMAVQMFRKMGKPDRHNEAEKKK